MLWRLFFLWRLLWICIHVCTVVLDWMFDLHFFKHYVEKMSVFSWCQQWYFSGWARLVTALVSSTSLRRLYKQLFLVLTTGSALHALCPRVCLCVCVCVCVVLGDPSLAFQPFPWYLGTGLFSSDMVFLGPKKQLSVSKSAHTAGRLLTEKCGEASETAHL